VTSGGVYFPWTVTHTTAHAMTLGDNLACASLNAGQKTGVCAMMGNQTTISNNLNVSDARLAGTTKLILTGTGTWTGHNNTSRYLALPVDVNTAGTITMTTVGLCSNTVNWIAGNAIMTGTMYLSGDMTNTIQLLGQWPTLAGTLYNGNTHALLLDHPLSVGNLNLAVGTLILPSAQLLTVTNSMTFPASTTIAVTNGAGLVVSNTTVVSETFTGTIYGNTTNGNVQVQSGATLALGVGNLLTASSLWCEGTSYGVCTVKGNTASSTSYLKIPGGTNNIIVRGVFTDIDATQGATLTNFWGSTLTRTAGITNMTPYEITGGGTSAPLTDIVGVY